MDKIEFIKNPAHNRQLQIRPALTDEERSQVFSLRYKVYIEEMHRHQKWANHENKTIIDPMDETATLLSAFSKNGDVVGICRLNFSDNCAFENRELYDFDALEKQYGKLVFITKLIIHKKFRYTTLFLQLACAAYTTALEQEAEAAILDCNDHLIHTFQSLGFSPYKGKANHPEYGMVTPMLLEMRNEQNLLLSNSPFKPLLLNFYKNPIQPINMENNYEKNGIHPI